ncbi:MAG TPA: GntR family transcriptional regulator [Chthoniobacteraceae bacterium]|nr:GntR family transcriptional regulator [Chthoniobacteraceae bacterium]
MKTSNPPGKPPLPPIVLDPDSGELLSVQIANHYRQAIASGVFPGGAHLPTCLATSKALGVAAQTVNRAFDILAEEGLVVRRRSVGTIVCGKEEAPPPLKRLSQRARRAALPICQITKDGSGSTKSRELFMDYLAGFMETFDTWKSRFELVHLREGESDVEMIRTLVEHRQARGLLSLSLSPAARDYLVESGFPTVFINVDESVRGGTSVVADSVRGYCEAWEYVERLGHRSAVLFGTQTSVFQRRLGQCASARERVATACAFHPPVQCAPNASPGAMYQALKAAYGPWKAGGRNRRWPTLIFALNDVLAVQLIRALREHGIAVPGDLSVIGFDDISVASHWDPPLTTLAVPRTDVARAAARLLLDLLAKRPGTQGVLQSFPVHLVERESCAPPASR